MNTKKLALSVTLACMLFGLPHVAYAQGFDYISNPPYVAVGPATVIPNGLPYCGTSSGLNLICYGPNFIKAAYNYPSSVDGTGQTILIVDAYGSPTIEADLALLDGAFGIPAPPSFTIFCPEGCPTPSANNKTHGPLNWSVETSLDVEYSHAMAPGANIVLVVAASSSGDAINVAETAAIAKYPGSVMSQSFGVGEFLIEGDKAQIKQAHKNYEAAQAAGTTVLASAGDFGAANAFSMGPKTIFGSVPNASFPASDPLVIAVGGTEGDPYTDPGSATLSCPAMTLCSAGLATFMGPCSSLMPRTVNPCTPVGYGGEQVWNEPEFAPQSTTGGAPSLIFGVPSYQSGLGLASRGTPDVTYNSAINGGVLVVNSALLGAPTLFIVGGTSAGSPQWAAIIALANQLAGKPLGFVNPALYSLARSSAYAHDFHDITIGNNQMPGTTPSETAGTGWDLASGWGTPNVSKLLPDLVECVTTAACP